MTFKTFNSIAIAIIAITLMMTTIVLPTIDKIKDDFAKIHQTMGNG